MDQIQQIAPLLLPWYAKQGRKHLPWRDPINPYRVWLSEIMLQQTQVDVVLPYYSRFLEHFPSLEALSNASVDQVLGLWSGLGYYARARNLHRCAQQLVNQENGQFPDDIESLQKLPGIGRSTAGAIASIAFGKQAAILDGNARRVLARYFGVEGWPGERAVHQQLWILAEQETPADRPGLYNQAIMDLGAMQCRRKAICASCPLQVACHAYKHHQTSTIPAPKPKSIKPHRELWMLLMTHADQVFLVQRPSQGIWGGLYSLPEFEDLQSLHNHTNKTDGLEALAPYDHAFTHYSLTIHPYRLEVDQAADTGRFEGEWFLHSELSTLGLPAPVRRIISGVQDV